jgi:hypothetical protein
VPGLRDGDDGQAARLEHARDLGEGAVGRLQVLDDGDGDDLVVGRVRRLYRLDVPLAEARAREVAVLLARLAHHLWREVNALERAAAGDDGLGQNARPHPHVEDAPQPLGQEFEHARAPHLKVIAVPVAHRVEARPVAARRQAVEVFDNVVIPLCCTSRHISR